MFRLNKTWGGLFICVLLFCLFSVPAYAQTIKTGEITADHLNVRQARGTSYAVITQLSKGTKVQILETSEGWYKITYNQLTGWVSASYVSVNQTLFKEGVVNGNDVNVRLQPNVSAQILSSLSSGTKIQILETSEGWHKIIFNESTGWISANYVSIVEKLFRDGVVSGNDVNIRLQANASSQVLTRVNKGDKVKVYENADGWHKIEISEGQIGWIFGEYLIIDGISASRGSAEETVVKTPEPAPEKAADNSSESKTSSQDLIDYAKSFLGVKYVYGGNTPKGFDCSGFVKYVYAHFGITLERVAANQAKYGTAVNRDSLVAGDLVFFDTNGGLNDISHVGIYLGDGKFIHASSGRTAKKVVISDMKSGFYSDSYMRARRYSN